MNRNYHRPLGRILSLMILMALTIPLSACGKNQEIEVYKANMTQFFENIQTIDSAINQLDPNAETVSTDLLSLLDSLDKSFQQMASLEVPDGFPGLPNYPRMPANICQKQFPIITRLMIVVNMIKLLPTLLTRTMKLPISVFNTLFRFYMVIFGRNIYL